MTEIIKFNDGDITINFNQAAKVHEDLEKQKTWLEIPSLPVNLQTKKEIDTSILKKERQYITAHDLNGNRLFVVVEGHITNEMINHMHNSDNKTVLKEIRNLLSNPDEKNVISDKAGTIFPNFDKS